MSSSPDYLFIDVLLLAYRLGHVRHEEQRTALLAAARAAQDSMGYMIALENFGVGRQTQLHSFAGEFLAAPEYYRAQYPNILGFRGECEATESFLGSQRVLFLVEPVLTEKQQKLFFDTYWWFVHNHEASYYDKKKGYCLGIYATELKDNASVVARFESYLSRLVNHKTQRVRERYEGFPADIVMAVLKRSFLT